MDCCCSKIQLKTSGKYDVSKKNVMIPQPEKRAPIKMAGYLEKRSKMKVVSRWKKLWFVLEGRLLTYYKSQLEYLSLSPCRGTVNMGLAASVLPGASLEIIVSTRSHTVSLRALNRSEHDVWLQALMDAMCLPNPAHNPCCNKPFHHFRYSTPDSDIVSYVPSAKRTVLNGHSNTLTLINGLNGVGFHSNNSPQYGRITYATYGTLPNAQPEGRLESRRGSMHSSAQDFIKDMRVDRLSRKFNKIAVSDSSIPGKFKEIKTNGPSSLRRSVSVEDEVNKFSENVYESLKEEEERHQISRNSRHGDQRSARINRSDSDCLTMSRERILNNQHRKFNSEQTKLMNSPTHNPSETLVARSPRPKSTSDRGNSSTLESSNKQRKLVSSLTPLSRRRGVVRSDTDLTIHPKNRHTDHYSEGLSNSYDFALLQELIRSKRGAPLPLLNYESHKNRSGSFLRKLSRAGDSSHRPRERRKSVRERSLSFLKKLVWKRETKWDLGGESRGVDTYDYQHQRLYPEMQGPDSDLEIISILSEMNMNNDIKKVCSEPLPDYDNVIISESEESTNDHSKGPNRYKKMTKSSRNNQSNGSAKDKEDTSLETKISSSRNKRCSSPWQSASNKADKRNSTDEEVWKDPPTLPRKTERCRHVAQDILFQDTDPGLKRLFSDSAVELGRRRDEMMERRIKMNGHIHSEVSLESFSIYQNTLGLFEERKRKNRKAYEKGEDPDYDIPRPHASLSFPSINQEGSINSPMTEKMSSNLLGPFDDSLDATALKMREEEQTMAPDSLEYDPWSLSDQTSSRDSWCTPHHILKPQILRSRHESIFQDSLNPSITLQEYMHLPHHGFIYS